jgi:hypothetical protein
MTMTIQRRARLATTLAMPALAQTSPVEISFQYSIPELFRDLIHGGEACHGPMRMGIAGVIRAGGQIRNRSAIDPEPKLREGTPCIRSKLGKDGDHHVIRDRPGGI